MARRFGYELEQLGDARKALMLPCEDETQAFRSAIDNCHKALELPQTPEIDDDDASYHVETVRRLMKIGADELTFEQKTEFSASVHYLADYFLITFFSGE